ncbi:MAG: hypothetical protein Q3X91_00245 [Bilophila sp.]|nr:hypothetical protein [Bilophila sp.]
MSRKNRGKGYKKYHINAVFFFKSIFFAKTARASDIKIFPKTFTPIEKKRRIIHSPSFGASPVWAAALRRKPPSAPTHREEEQAPLSNGQFRPYGGVGR